MIGQSKGENLMNAGREELPDCPRCGHNGHVKRNGQYGDKDRYGVTYFCDMKQGGCRANFTVREPVSVMQQLASTVAWGLGICEAAAY